MVDNRDNSRRSFGAPSVLRQIQSNPIMPNKLPINVSDLLHQRKVEGERIEYKAGWNPDAVLRTVCAFANDFENLGGGYVVIGQDCDAHGLPVFPPVGLATHQLDKIQQELLAACQLIQPPYFPVLTMEVVEDRNLTVLWAPGGQTRPYKATASVTTKHKTWHYYKNVGLLFFNDAPDQFFPCTQIDVVWFPEGAGGDRFDEKIFKDPLGRMVRDALSFIERSYLVETVIKHPDRAEATRLWNFPYAAIEEAVVNAVYHRSYEEREPVEVRIGRDELVVLSFPGPDRSIKLADFEAGRAVSRRYRNRRIGEFLKELDLTEGRSTGMPKILKVMAANGSPAPLFETDDDRCSYVIRLPVHVLAQQPSDQVTTEVTGEVTGEVERLLRVLVAEMSRKQIQDALTLKHEDHFREAYLKPALAAGVVEMTLPAKPRSGNQRYRLTALGRQWLASQGTRHS
jgi:predicted HTH transcriptional regulator